MYLYFISLLIAIACHESMGHMPLDYEFDSGSSSHSHGIARTGFGRVNHQSYLKAFGRPMRDPMPYATQYRAMPRRLIRRRPPIAMRSPTVIRPPVVIRPPIIRRPSPVVVAPLASMVRPRQRVYRTMAQDPTIGGQSRSAYREGINAESPRELSLEELYGMSVGGKGGRRIIMVDDPVVIAEAQETTTNAATTAATTKAGTTAATTKAGTTGTPGPKTTAGPTTTAAPAKTTQAGTTAEGTDAPTTHAETTTGVPTTEAVAKEEFETVEIGAVTNTQGPDEDESTTASG